MTVCVYTCLQVHAAMSLQSSKEDNIFITDIFQGVAKYVADCVCAWIWIVVHIIVQLVSLNAQSSLQSLKLFSHLLLEEKN